MTQSMAKDRKEANEKFLQAGRIWSWCRREICKLQRCDEKHGYIVEDITRDKTKGY